MLDTGIRERGTAKEMSWLIGLSLIGAFAFGIWLGLPRRFDQPMEEIDRRLVEPGQHNKAKRHITFLNLLQRKREKGSDRRQRNTRTPFRMN